MARFRDLKLGAELCDLLESLGYRVPTPLQATAIPILLRGTGLLALASPGSGKTLGYSVAVVERTDPRNPHAQALVLRATDSKAAETAAHLNHLAAGRGVAIGALRPQRLETASRGQVIVGSPGCALEAVRGSLLRLDGLRIFVVDGLSDMIEWGEGAALETIASLIPKETQRVVVTGSLTSAVEDWLERHARRLVRVDAAASDGLDESAPPLSAEYAVEPAHRCVERIVWALDSAEARGVARAVVFRGTQAEARATAEALAVRGFQLQGGEGGEGGIVVLPYGEEVSVGGAMSISCGAPPDPTTLRRRCEGAERAVLVVLPSQVLHLRRCADAARVRLHTVRTPLPEETARSLEEIRQRLRSTLSGRDWAPYLLALEPLFAEFTPAELAAAATALLRERTAAEPSEPKVRAWTRLYMAVGRRDGVRPADLVGCITGEAGISGTQVGKIEIRDTFSVVEVSADVADRVLRSLANVTLRARSVHARPYREP